MPTVASKGSSRFSSLRGTMDNLIEALTIFRKYANRKFPTMCAHDILMITGIEEGQPSPEDVSKLEELGFFWDKEFECWASFKFGSA